MRVTVTLVRFRPVLSLEQRVVQFENRLKLAGSELQQDVDLSQVMVKPEDTADVPKGRRSSKQQPKD